MWFINSVHVATYYVAQVLFHVNLDSQGSNYITSLDTKLWSYILYIGPVSILYLLHICYYIILIHIHICYCYVMPRVLYQVYNLQAWGQVDTRGRDITNIFHDFKVVFIQLNEATNHTVHISNHGSRSTFIVLSEALKGVFSMTYNILNTYI